MEDLTESPDLYYADPLNNTHARDAAISSHNKAINKYDHELAKMPRWQRLIPAIGQAATYRSEIKKNQRQIKAIERYWDKY